MDPLELVRCPSDGAIFVSQVGERRLQDVDPLPIEVIGVFWETEHFRLEALSWALRMPAETIARKLSDAEVEGSGGISIFMWGPLNVGDTLSMVLELSRTPSVSERDGGVHHPELESVVASLSSTVLVEQVLEPTYSFFSATDLAKKILDLGTCSEDALEYSGTTTNAINLPRIHVVFGSTPPVESRSPIILTEHSEIVKVLDLHGDASVDFERVWSLYPLRSFCLPRIDTNYALPSSRSVSTMAPERVYDFPEEKFCKRIFGHVATGSSLCYILQSFVRDIEQRVQPDIHSAWARVVHAHSEAAAKEALSMYEELISDLKNPSDGQMVSEEQLEELNEQFREIAIDVFESNALYTGSDRGRVKKNLEHQLRAFFIKVRGEHYKTTLERSREVIRVSSQELLHMVTDSQQNKLERFKNAYLAFLENFRDSTAASRAQAVALQEFCGAPLLNILEKVFEADYNNYTHTNVDEEIEKQRALWEAKRMDLAKELEQQKKEMKCQMEKERQAIFKMRNIVEARTMPGSAESQSLRRESLTLKAKYEKEMDDHRTTQRKLVEANDRIKELEKRRRKSEIDALNEKELSVTLEKGFTEKLSNLEQSYNQEIIAHQSHIQQINRRFDKLKEESDSHRQIVKQLQDEKAALQDRLNDIFIKIASLPTHTQRQLLLDLPLDDFAGALADFVDKA